MSQHSEQQLHGDQLATLIAQTAHPIKVFRMGESRPSSKVNARQALLLLKGGAFIGGGSTKRIRYIREVNAFSNAWQSCWRTAQAGVLPFWPSIE